jgi:hypothetical protein
MHLYCTTWKTLSPSQNVWRLLIDNDEASCFIRYYLYVFMSKISHIFPILLFCFHFRLFPHNYSSSPLTRWKLLKWFSPLLKNFTHDVIHIVLSENVPWNSLNMRNIMLHYGQLLRVFMYTEFSIGAWVTSQRVFHYHYLQLLFTVPKFCADTHHCKIKPFCKMPITDSQITHNSYHIVK